MDKLKVFISFAGTESLTVATKLREWLPLVIQFVDPWLSRHNIDAGARWGQELEGALQGAKVGIICLTKANLKAEWLNFESGAISKTVEDKTLVCPYLVGLEPSEVTYPLAQFQMKRATKVETFELLQSINKAVPQDQALSEESLRVTFDKWWPDLDDFLRSEIKHETTSTHQPRPAPEILEELLALVRELHRRPVVISEDERRRQRIRQVAGPDSGFSGYSGTSQFTNEEIAGYAKEGFETLLAKLFAKINLARGIKVKPYSPHVDPAINGDWVYYQTAGGGIRIFRYPNHAENEAIEGPTFDELENVDEMEARIERDLNNVFDRLIRI